MWSFVEQGFSVSWASKHDASEYRDRPKQDIYVPVCDLSIFGELLT